MMTTIKLEQGKYYHIYNRGNNKEYLFKNEDNYYYFLQLLSKYILPSAEIYCYCLLSNHFHLLIKVKETDDQHKTQCLKLEQRFSNFFNAYAKAFNKMHNRTGKLFQERFRRKRIDNDDYFAQIIFYIHANPQLHKIAKDFRKYPFSSYSPILSSRNTDLSRAKLFDYFGGRRAFEQYHVERIKLHLALSNLC